MRAKESAPEKNVNLALILFVIFTLTLIGTLYLYVISVGKFVDYSILFL